MEPLIDNLDRDMKDYKIRIVYKQKLHYKANTNGSYIVVHSPLDSDQFESQTYQ